MKSKSPCLVLFLEHVFPCLVLFLEYIFPCLVLFSEHIFSLFSAIFRTHLPLLGAYCLLACSQDVASYFTMLLVTGCLYGRK